MVLKRQTIWLLTMLSLMVVLSAYYLFNNEPVNMNDYADGEHHEALDSVGEVFSDMDMDLEFTVSDNPVDQILTQQYEKEVSRAMQMSQYEEIIKSEATAQEIAEAMEKKEILENMTEAEYTIESMLRAAGYEEAVVVADSNHVDVVVRSDSLDRKQVVEIIGIVKEQLKVPGNKIQVSYK